MDAGTSMVKDIYPGPASSSQYWGEIVDFNGVALFRASTPSGAEIWRSDGTEAGTYQIKDIVPGSEGSFPQGFAAISGGRALFSALQDASGREMWGTDGTEAGTVRLTDIYPGTGSSYAGENDELIFANRILFGAMDDVHGQELWAMSLYASGSVPDGADTPGTPLKAQREGDGGVTLTWGASCFPYDTDYAVYRGTLGNASSAAPMQCTTGGARSVTFYDAPGDAFYLVVPQNNSVEGSYGRNSLGQERPVSLSACATQVIQECY